MDIEKAGELLPRFIMGKLCAQDVLAVCRALAESPSLIDDMRLTLALHDGLMQDAPPPPCFPQAVYRESQSSALVPGVLKDSLRKLRQAAGITGSAVRMALKFI